MAFLGKSLSIFVLPVQKEAQKGHFFIRCFPYADAHWNRSHVLNAVQGFPLLYVLVRYTTEKENPPMAL